MSAYCSSLSWGAAHLRIPTKELDREVFRFDAERSSAKRVSLIVND